MSKIRILIVEDEPLIAEDIRGFLEHAGFTVSGVAYDGSDALEFFEQKNYDAVLLDITLGGAPDGIALANILNEKYDVPFVFLTSHSDRNTLERVKSTRPGGYLVKPFDESDLFTSLEIAVSNYISKTVKKDHVFSLEFINSKIPNPLSEREFDVLNLLKEGKSNKEISEGNFVSINTVKTHLQHIYSKLDVKNRTELIFKINNLISS